MNTTDTNSAIKEEVKLLPSLQDIPVSELGMYSQISNYIEKKGIRYIKELANLNQNELMNELNINEEVCNYIYSRIDEYCRTSIFPPILCPNLPKQCINLSIDILNLPSDNIVILKNQNVHTVGEAAVLNFHNFLLDIVQACRIVVDNFRQGNPQVRNDEKAEINLITESNITCKENSVELERTVTDPAMGNLYIPQTDDTQAYSQSNENTNEEKTQHKYSTIQEFVTLENLVNIMANRPIITEEEKKYLSWDDISYRLALLWDIPIEELNVSLDIKNIRYKNINKVGDVLSLILESNLNWLKQSYLTAGQEPPSTLKITPLLLKTKEYMEKLRNNNSVLPNNLYMDKQNKHIVNKISSFFNELVRT